VASAAELRNLLRGHLDEDLLQDVTSLVGWRNFLAHSYLMTRLIGPGARATGRATDFPASTSQFPELHEIGKAFADTAHKLAAAATEIAAKTQPADHEDGPAVVQETVTTLMAQLIFPERSEFSRSR